MPNDTLRHRDFASQLTADAYHHLIRTVRQALPPPPGDSPDDLVRRDHAAIARIAALAPANAAEADLAALYVAAFERVQQPHIRRPGPGRLRIPVRRSSAAIVLFCSNIGMGTKQ